MPSVRGQVSSCLNFKTTGVPQHEVKIPPPIDTLSYAHMARLFLPVFDLGAAASGPPLHLRFPYCLDVQCTAAGDFHDKMYMWPAY